MKVLKFFLYAFLIIACIFGAIVACSGPVSDNLTQSEQVQLTQPHQESEAQVKDDYARLTSGQKNALAKAKSYLSHSAFSRKGLIEQLEYEKFTTEDATFAVDNCEADWNEQALKKACSYLNHSAFSCAGLTEQLEYEGFTAEEAKYGVDNCGADWSEQAVLKAESYLSHSSFSRDGLIDQLEYEGFTREQAIYGVDQAY